MKTLTNKNLFQSRPVNDKNRSETEPEGRASIANGLLFLVQGKKEGRLEQAGIGPGNALTVTLASTGIDIDGTCTFV